MTERLNHEVVRLGASLAGAARQIGLWAYLAAVGGGWPDTSLVRDAERAASGASGQAPYWGSRAAAGGPVRSGSHTPSSLNGYRRPPAPAASSLAEGAADASSWETRDPAFD